MDNPYWDTWSSFKITYDPNGAGGTYFRWYWASPGLSYSLLTTSAHNFTPDDAQMETETHDRATQYPGTFNNKSTDTGLQMYTPAGGGGSWVPYAGYENTTGGGAFQSNSPAIGSYGSSLKTWDADCPG